MILGFTGTQHGMSVLQRQNVYRELAEADSFHHGSCVGADYQAHLQAIRRGLEIHLHPPIDRSKCAWCPGALVVHPERPYKDRNQDIVDAVDRLVAAPRDTEKSLPRSGTWMTVRMARRKGIPIAICWPDGSVTREKQP